MNLHSQRKIYPWYSEVSASEPLQQGDFVLQCPILSPSTENFVVNQTINADILEYDVIVMSQSCDLLVEKINLVLVCPFFTMTEFSSRHKNIKIHE